ncbi:MAG: hypothetical protein ABEJ28_12430 [Salinigranum sp.]
MAAPLRVEAGELTAAEILAAIEEGRRVVVRTEMFGSVHEVALRHDGETFYCDTPTTLKRHTTAEDFRACIENMGYAKSDGD